MRSQSSSLIRLLRKKLEFARTMRNRFTTSGYRRNLRFEQCEDRCMLATFMVTNNTDAPENTPAAVGTLRQAIFNANQSQAASDMIKFSDSAFASGGTIQLTLGQLSISESNQLIIDGRGMGGNPLGITIAAHDPTPTQNNGDGSRVFDIPGSGQVEINGLTLTGGDAADGGGAIQHGATLTIENSVITGNHGGAGGIYSYGALTVRNSTISGNHGVVGGGIAGGFFAGGTGGMVIIDSVISGNTATYFGGGIKYDPASFTEGAGLTISRTTISNNHAALDGGGLIANTKNITIDNCTISGNTAGRDAGAILFNALSSKISKITYSTIFDNHAGRDGGGLYAVGGGTVRVENSTFSHNTASGQGGAMWLAAPTSVRNDTITKNKSNDGGEFGRPVFSCC
jgi:hypothetical protein